MKNFTDEERNDHNERLAKYEGDMRYTFRKYFEKCIKEDNDEMQKNVELFYYSYKLFIEEFSGISKQSTRFLDIVAQYINREINKAEEKIEDAKIKVILWEVAKKDAEIVNVDDELKRAKNNFAMADIAGNFWNAVENEMFRRDVTQNKTYSDNSEHSSSNKKGLGPEETAAAENEIMTDLLTDLYISSPNEGMAYKAYKKKETNAQKTTSNEEPDGH